MVADDTDSLGAAQLGGLSWWTWDETPGASTRPSEIKEYRGVEDALRGLGASLDDLRPDVIFAFSQGASLAGLFFALASPARAAEDAVSDELTARVALPTSQHVPRVAILVGGFLPNDPRWAGVVEARGVGAGVRVLHVTGEGDIFVTPDRTERFAALFADGQVHRHPGGHMVPTGTGAFKRALVDFLDAVPSPSLPPAPPAAPPAWRPDDGNNAVVERALGYPYPRPGGSFVMVEGETWAIAQADAGAAWGGADGASVDLSTLLVLPPGATAPLLLSDALRDRGFAATASTLTVPRRAVLGIGSNASPQQLRRKYPPRSEGGWGDAKAHDIKPTIIPVLEASLEGWDSVFSPLLAGYGSLTATLAPSPGARLRCAVTLLDEVQLNHMHSTEGGYFLVELEGRIALAPPFDPDTGACAFDRATDRLDKVLCYVQKDGPLLLPRSEGAPAPVALAEMECEGRTLTALTQAKAQEAARATLGGAVDSCDLRAWIIENVGDGDVRRGRWEALARCAAGAAAPGLTPLASIDGTARPTGGASLTQL